MKCNPLLHILEIAKDKEVPRQFIVNDLEALIKELRDHKRIEDVIEINEILGEI
jgi:hypothetical protein